MDLRHPVLVSSSHTKGGLKNTSPVTHMNESRHKYACVTSRKWTSHVTKSRHELSLCRLHTHKQGVFMWTAIYVKNGYGKSRKTHVFQGYMQMCSDLTHTQSPALQVSTPELLRWRTRLCGRRLQKVASTAARCAKRLSARQRVFRCARAQGCWNELDTFLWSPAQHAGTLGVSIAFLKQRLICIVVMSENVCVYMYIYVGMCV